MGIFDWIYDFFSKREQLWVVCKNEKTLTVYEYGKSILQVPCEMPKTGKGWNDPEGYYTISKIYTASKFTTNFPNAVDNAMGYIGNVSVDIKDGIKVNQTDYFKLLYQAQDFSNKTGREAKLLLLNFNLDKPIPMPITKPTPVGLYSIYFDWKRTKKLPNVIIGNNRYIVSPL